MTLAPPTVPRTAAHTLLHGTCPPGFLYDLHTALARHPYRLAREPREREEYLHARLHALVTALPPARTLLYDADRLAAALAWAVIADPRLGMNLVTHTMLCSGSLVRLGPDGDGAVGAALDALDTAGARGSYLITEAGQANSHLATRTRAVLDPESGDFVLDTPDAAAAKFGWVPAHEGRRVAVVLARTEVGGVDGGVFPFLVELADETGLRPGVTLSAPSEIGALPLTFPTVTFRGVRVPAAHWLRDGATLTGGVLSDPLGSATARLQRSVNVGQGLWGALPSAAAAVARQSAVLAVRYARHRRTQARLAPGLPLLSYRSQQRALLGALADAYALTCAAARARELLQGLLDAPADPGGHAPTDMGFSPWTAVSRDLTAYKAYTVRAAERVVAACQRRCGYPGLVDTSRLPGYRGFQHAFDPAGGDSQLMYYDLGRALADPAPDADRAASTDPVPATGAVEVPAPRPADPTDPQWWPAVLRAHEATLTREVRTAHEARRHLDAFEAWDPLLDQAGELGEVHAVRLAAQDVPWARDHFLADVPAPLRDALDDLAELSALRAARRWSGALLTHGTLAPGDLAGLPARADLLCERLLPRLPLIEELFAFPDDVVHSGIGEGTDPADDAYTGPAEGAYTGQEVTA